MEGSALRAPLELRESAAGAFIVVRADVPADNEAHLPLARSASPLSDDSDEEIRIRAQPFALRLLTARAIPGLSPEARSALEAAATAAAAAPGGAARGGGGGGGAHAASVLGPELQLAEDWKLRQFWTATETAVALADEAFRLAVSASARLARPAVIACLSFPSVFKALQARLQKEGSSATESSVRPLLFEFDRRFAAFGDAFIFFDCGEPIESLRGCTALHGVDVILADPPYLTADCLRSYSVAVEALRAAPDAPLLLCTGASLEDSALTIFGARRTRFPVRHAVGGLANPFALFCNYTLSGGEGPMGGWED